MTPGNPNYKSYFVKHDEAACNVIGIVGSARDARYAAPLTMVGGALKVGGTERVTLEIYDLHGARVGARSAQAPFQWAPQVNASGVHVIRAITPKGVYTERATLF
jgi:hypothetical protein